jgi:hypothetical protein
MLAFSHTRMSLEAGAKRPAARTPFWFDFALLRCRPTGGPTDARPSVFLIFPFIEGFGFVFDFVLVFQSFYS